MDKKRQAQAKRKASKVMSNSSSLDGYSLLKSRVSLIGYISKFLGKEPKATSQNSFMVLCPIHNEQNSESMSVDDSKGVYHCFSCGSQGSIIDFYMAMNAEADTPDKALVALAAQENVELPKSSFDKQAVSKKRITAALNAVSDAATDFLFHDDSDAAEKMFAYLVDRGVTDDIIDRWSIGGLPTGRDAVRFVRKAAHDDVEALVAGNVLSRSDHDGSMWATHAGRILFPIFDRARPDDVIGFGARQVDGVKSYGKGKYLNPTTTDVYDKSKVLYGQHLVKKGQHVAVVEGYLDAIAINEFTDQTGVACCGTAFTVHQMNMLSASKVVTSAFDSDDAGRRALASTVWMENRAPDVELRAILFGDGSDSKVDPWSLGVSDPDALNMELSMSAEHLPTAVHAAFDGMNTENFDKWVSKSVTELNMSSKKDRVIAVAAELREMSKTAYSRNLSTSNFTPSSREEMPEGAERLNPMMHSLVRRLLQVPSLELDSALAILDPWDDDKAEAVRLVLPVDTDLDRAVVERLILGHSARSRSVDIALSNAMPDPNAPIEDISAVLERMSLVLRNDVDWGDDNLNSPFLVSLSPWLSEVENVSRFLHRQLELFFELMSLSVGVVRAQK